MSEDDDTPQMSDLVGVAVDTAARDTVAESGGMVTGFVALVTYLNAEGDRCWALAAGEDQGLTQSLGMATILEMTVRAQCEAAVLGAVEDDDA